MASAADIPYVFGENSSDVASLTPDQLEQVSSASMDLVGVPAVSSLVDSAVIEVPVTGGDSGNPGSTEARYAGVLKEIFDDRVDANSSYVLDEGAVLAAKYPGEHTIDQICSIYDYLKNGDGVKKGWSYVSDRRGPDFYRYANESLKMGERAGCSGVGDCDDFAILMSALVESIGGTTRIILVRNNTSGGHAYAEVYMGQMNAQNNRLNDIIAWLKQKFNSDKIFLHVNTTSQDVWLNLDWGPDEKGIAHPGGPFFKGDRHIELHIRSEFGKTPLKPPEITNRPPKIISLTADKTSPQDVGSTITWTADARDLDNDQIFYRFFLNEGPKTKWITNNKWTWNITEGDIGDNQIMVHVRDGKNAGLDIFDNSMNASFAITEPHPNRPPFINSLVADKSSPQEAGTTITWVTSASDQDNDPLLYKFFLNNKSATDWIADNKWTWITTEADIGDNQVTVQARDGKHTNQDKFDDDKIASFTIIKPPENQPPTLGSLEPNKSSPQEVGTSITWTASASDPDGDPILYKFMVNGRPDTDWISGNTWQWTSTEGDVGDNKFEVHVRDGRHASLDSFDNSKNASFKIIGAKSILRSVSDPAGINDKGRIKISDLKNYIHDKIEPENYIIKQIANMMAAEYRGDCTIEQVCAIYGYLKYGNASTKGWYYVDDPRGVIYYSYANESLKLGKMVNCAGAGDCDDFAILMSSLIESIGGTTRIIIAYNNTTGHAYTEVYLGKLQSGEGSVETIISWLEKKYSDDKIYTHIDPETKEVWLNLDWGEDRIGEAHPGSEFNEGKRHIIIAIREGYEKRPLNLS